jgi:hypothetical protein
MIVETTETVNDNVAEIKMYKLNTRIKVCDKYIDEKIGVNYTQAFQQVWMREG